ncbi:MAG: Opacity protein [Rhodobacteraceae bacterium HLUCCA24]|nr:MAG: Opacity protein [Rhodobacteraceae bacterium HLUCCA24]
MKYNAFGMLRAGITAAALGAFVPAGAFAAGLDETPGEPVVESPAPPPAPAGIDWTGFYGGAQLGYGDVSTSGAADLDGDGAIGGVTLGYDYDFGNYVLGGAFDYDFADIDVNGATTLESVARVKVRGGPKIGTNGLLYAAAGGAQAEAEGFDSDTGWFLGAGYEQMVTDRFSVGVEALYHEFDDFDDSGIDVQATTVQLRGTFRF